MNVMQDDGHVRPIKSVDKAGNSYIFGASIGFVGDKGFTKVFWGKLRPILIECSIADNKVMDFLVTKGSTGKPINETVDAMSKELKLNRKTVQRSLSFFMKCDFIRRGSHRDIYINPDVIFRGKTYYRKIALSAYQFLPHNIKDNNSD